MYRKTEGFAVRIAGEVAKVPGQPSRRVISAEHGISGAAKAAAGAKL